MKTLRPFLLFALLVTTAAVGYGTPAVITSGTVSMGAPFGDIATTLNVSGDNFSTVFSGRNVYNGFLPCGQGCNSGQTISLSATSGGWDWSNLSGGVTIDGAQYSFNHSSSIPQLPEVQGTGGISFTGGTWLIPSSNDPFLTLTAPFTMKGGILMFAQGVQPFSLDFAGEGTMTLVLKHYDNNFYRQFGFITYDFTTPTPEPASMLLMGTALLGLAAKLGRRTRGRQRAR